MASPLQGYMPHRQVNFDVLGPAWKLFQQEAATWLLTALILMAVSGIVGVALSIVVPIVGGFVGSIPGMVLSVGAFRMALKQIRGAKIAVGDVFDISDVIAPAIVAALLWSIATSIGFVLCILPGLVLVGLLLFTFPLIADRRMDGIEAMKLSVETLKDEWLMAAVFSLVLGLIATVGLLACGVGILVAGPVILLAEALLYRAYFPEAAAAPAASPAPPEPPSA
jgi:hypothetical protein